MAGIRELPPLRLHIDAVTPSGRHYRWGDDEPNATNVPSGLRFSDTAPGGFESMDCTLARKPGTDYADLERLSTLRVVGAGGDVAGEYRLERAPRTSGEQMAVSPSAVGWQAHLDDNKSAREIYVDRDLGHWGDIPLTRRVAFATSAISTGDFSWATNANGGLIVAFPNQALGAQTLAETFYAMPPGLTASTVTYFAGTTSFSGWLAQLVASAAENTANENYTLAGGVLTNQALTPGRRYLALRAYSNGSAATPAAGSNLRVTTIAVYGTHGVQTRAISGEPDGVYASDVAADAVSRWAPLLRITDDSIQSSVFVISHLVFPEPTTAAEIIRQATRYGLQDWAVWEDKTFYWHERGARGRSWRARIGPSGLEETGPQMDRLWESIIVQYQDVDGSTRTVGPVGSGADTEDAVLKDDDPENPANKLGIIRRDLLTMGVSTAAGATEVGRRFLEQTKLLDSSGRARIVGHVMDDRGILHPYWRMRAGDTISFIDAAQTSPRRIVRTDKNTADRSCAIDLDAPPDAMAALLERLGVSLVSLGL